jgi:hypothetical protein
MRSVYERLPGDGYYTQVPGTFHADMTDVPLWSPETCCATGSPVRPPN